MKKSFKIIYSSLFVAICSMPLVLFPFIKTDAKIEKRELSEFPSLFIENRLNKDFSTQFESWFNDRIPLRSQFLSASNLIRSELLHTPSSNVINGTGGWLYYENESYDYMNSNALSDDQINSICVTLSLIEENITSRGGHFTFVPAPNKASVYPEYMPFYYKKADTSNLNRIITRLGEMGVSYTDLPAVLNANKDKGIYHRRDSHWNNLGAMIGYEAIMNSLDKEHRSYDNVPYTYDLTWRADLDKLLYPAGGFMDYQYEYDLGLSDFRFLTPGNVTDNDAALANFMSDKEEGDSNIKTENPAIQDGRELYMVRDSFGRALLPFFIDNYNIATFRRTDCPDIATLADGTDMVYEIVERNLGNIISTAPFMYAPVRDINISDLPTGTFPQRGDEIEPVVDIQGYGIRIYGKISENIDMGDGRVYVVLDNGTGTTVFEAFPIFESKMLNVEGTCGFSALISNDSGLGGQYEMSLITGGKVYPCGQIDLAGDQSQDASDIPDPTQQGSHDDPYVLINGAQIRPGDIFENVRGSMGTEIRPAEEIGACDPQCRSNYVYHYDGVDVYVSFDGNIYEFDMNDSTGSGEAALCGQIRVGSSYDEVISVLGDPPDSMEDNVFYSLSNSNLQVVFTNGKVSSICYIQMGYV